MRTSAEGARQLPSRYPAWPTRGVGATRTSLHPPGPAPLGLAEDLAAAPCPRVSPWGPRPRAGPLALLLGPSGGRAGIRYLHTLQDWGSVLQDLGRQDHIGRFRLRLGRRSPRASSGRHFQLHFLLKHKTAAGSAHSPHRSLPGASRRHGRAAGLQRDRETRKRPHRLSSSGRRALRGFTVRLRKPRSRTRTTVPRHLWGRPGPQQAVGLVRPL